MKILFVIRSPQIFHYYESIYNALLKRGHNVEILFDKDWGDNEYKKDFKFTFEWTKSSKKSFRRRLLLFFREVLSWRRYLLTKTQSSFYADRWLKYVSPKFRFLVKIFPPVKIFIKTKFVGSLLKNFEKNTKPDIEILKDIQSRTPDIVVVSPVNFRQSSADLEYLKAGKFLGIPTALPVISWDNLTTKGIFHSIPAILLVWNESQAKEAQEQQGVSKENIKITGAPFFDKWFFGLAPNTPPPDKKFILYLGSSSNIAPDERWLIKEVRNILDSSEDERIKKTQIIFRPHPANFKIYQDFNVFGVLINPKEGEMPKTKAALQDFYNIFYYSSAVVSINTSGMVDAILVGKPVISLERDEFKKTQILAQHYVHMRQSGALYVTKTSEEFIKVFTQLLSGNDPKKIEREKFITTFIRPCGLDKSAGEVVALEIENLVNKHVQK